MLMVALALIISTMALSPPKAEAASSFELFDTAWDMPFWAELSEVDVYFDHLETSGYTGVWLSLMNHTTGIGIDGVSPITGTPQAHFVNNQFDLNPTYRAHVETILDMADGRGLRVGLLPMWGVGYLHTSTNGNCAGVNQGPLQASNSADWGTEVGNAFGNHPALHYWILGGDNFCTPTEPVEVWENMASGIRSTGATQPMSYHSAGWSARQELFADEPWVDFLSPQTGHCKPAADSQLELENLVAQFGKPVIAAEMRYETIEPSWMCPEHGPGDPVLPADVLSDAQAAVAAGVSGMLYGHNERWSWGRSANGSPSAGWAGVQPSLSAPGEQLVLNLLGLPMPPPTTTTTTVAPGDVLSVIAKGKTGGEIIEIEVAGQVVQSHALTTGLLTYMWTSPTPINPADVRILYTNDNGTARDAFIDAIAINTSRYETEAATTESKGTWGGGNCGIGHKQSEWLHCNGWVHYDQGTPTPPSPTTSTTTTTTTTTLPPGNVLTVTAKGKTGGEVIEIEVAGQTVQSHALTTTPINYSWTSPTPINPSDVRILFTNDNGTPRDAFIDAIDINGTRYETEAPTTKSQGTWGGGNCGIGHKQSEWLHCNGWFHYDQGAPPVTPPAHQVVRVIARGTSGTETIDLEVGGQVVISRTLAQSLSTYSWISPVPVNPSDIRVLFTNDNGTARDVFIDAVTLDGTRYETEAASTESKGSWANGNCGIGHKQSEWLHCNGWVHYDR